MFLRRGHGGYSGTMRRPDIELSDEAAAYVERHPDMIARLAGQAYGATSAEPTEAAQVRFRGYVRERLALAGADDARAAGQAFLARFAG